MVGTLKRWLGIEGLERENLILAKALKSHTDRIDTLDSDMLGTMKCSKQALDIALDCQAVYKDQESRLQEIEGKPKAEPKPKARTVPFRQFKAAAESLPEED